MARPPRPKGIKRNPRHKKPKPLPPLEALQVLVARPMGTAKSHYLRHFQEMFKSRNHRGAAILLATYVENALTEALKTHLNLTTGQARRAFRSSGFLWSFGNKILLASMLDVIGPETFQNLEYIRQIRNAFAHSNSSISFRDKEVRDVCALLVVPADLTIFPYIHTRNTPRDRFNDVCYITSKNLREIRGNALNPPVMKLTPSNWETYNISLNRRFPIRQGHDLILKRQSLP